MIISGAPEIILSLLLLLLLLLLLKKIAETLNQMCQWPLIIWVLSINVSMKQNLSPTLSSLSVSSFAAKKRQSDLSKPGGLAQHGQGTDGWAIELGFPHEFTPE